ncbi:MAG: hypothetical protein M0Z99_00820 [Betaproteobacteria bacterium]|nr:hypothetical protein [Betaproteobacteria bacterium]
MKPPFTLIHAHPPDDVVEALEYLLTEARSGRLIGLAYGAMFRRRHYIVETAGEAHRNPLFALGVIDILEDELRARVRGNKAA